MGNHIIYIDKSDNANQSTTTKHKDATVLEHTASVEYSLNDTNKSNKSQSHESSEASDVTEEPPLISHCHHDLKFVSRVQRIKQTLLGNYHDELDVVAALDDFLYLLNKCNDNDEYFEYIYNYVGQCSMKQCKSFHRNYRNRTNDKIENKCNSNIDIVNTQILDKIHCFLLHSYDIGNKIKIEEQSMIQSIVNNVSLNGRQCIINETAINTRNFLKNKRKQTYRDSNLQILIEQNNTKYNQFGLKNTEYCNKNHDSEYPTYSFGHLFKYNYKGENIVDDEYISASSKYVNLKTELTTNRIATISMEQFDNEYKKAAIHLNSFYCKKKFVPWTDEENSNIQLIFNIEYLLALMIYCNYTGLQFQFSKTYRLNRGEKHSEFYHLGKFLKISVRKFGTKISDGDVAKFFHGIGEKVLLPDYFGGCCQNGVTINCPLSTSSSLEVALNFANHNRGMVIEFVMERLSKDTRYFSMSWLSDFSNEKEYLFIQNGEIDTLRINNIVEAESGVHIEIILAALSLLENISEVWYLKPSFVEIACAILSDQLSYNFPEYQPFKSLSTYAKAICDSWFQHKECIDIHYGLCADNFEDFQILKTLFLSEVGLINFKLIKMLFPNLRVVSLTDVDLRACILDDILMNAKKK
eukprot:538455_1